MQFEMEYSITGINVFARGVVYLDIPNWHHKIQRHLETYANIINAKVYQIGHVLWVIEYDQSYPHNEMVFKLAYQEWDET